MPTYEYVCSSCGRRFEVVQKFSDAPLETCEVCGGPLKRVFHPVGVVLKGSGFYSTDNRSSKKPLSPATKEGSTDKAGEKSAGDKPAEKPSEKKAPSSEGGSSQKKAAGENS